MLNVAGPDACSVREIATRIGKRVGIDPVLVADPAPRETDLIADREQLLAAGSTSFRTFDEGLDDMLSAP